uniref:Potassium channel domain-containing protein n=1 Tax=Ananas comosus var. bracteatus TaxID=296719 RepID=A0A6V7PVU4_ANACO|nr:unnamed protein product [Ananas comosus var. bracteatus]
MGDNKKPLLSSTPPPPTTTPSSSSSSSDDDDSSAAAAAAAAAADDDDDDDDDSAAAAADAALSTPPLRLYVKTPTSPTVDALYFSVSTLATVGYGDAHPGTSLFKVLSVPFTLLGYALLNLLVAVTVPAAAKLLAVLRRRYRVLIAAAAILLPVSAGALVFHFVETQGWVDSVYMSVISVTTVGYGDEVFKTRPGRVFASVWLLIGTLAVTHAFNFLVDKLLDWWTPRTNFVTIRLAALGQMENLGDE